MAGLVDACIVPGNALEAGAARDGSLGPRTAARGGRDPSKNGQLVGRVLTRQPGGEAAQLQIGTLHVPQSKCKKINPWNHQPFCCWCCSIFNFSESKNRLSAFAGFTHLWPDTHTHTHHFLSLKHARTSICLRCVPTKT